MTPEQIQAMAKGLAEGQAVWYVLSACIGGAIAGLGTYLAEKGKNRATKEDIADITKKVKEVEDVFNRGLSDLNAHHQLRMVAAERRLLAHQEAYSLWDKMMTTVHTDEAETRRAAFECQEWYKKNCIFLGDQSRDAFQRAYLSAPDHQMAKKTRDVELVQRNWQILMAPQTALLQEVALPPISRDYSKPQRDGAGLESSPV
ncbi:hypothetical protein [Delftia acidovorans]|uniref:hypothetical protein n=1 Tax=Delftia acidovorans TaxID=80866 RepID=UPI002FDE58A9